MLRVENIASSSLLNSKEEQTNSENVDALNDVVSPFTGQFIELSKIPDEVLSKKTLGDGYGVYLSDGKIIAPISGKVTTVFPTKHALGFTDNFGNEVLLHIGIDTVNLKGKGFNILIKPGDNIVKGQKIAEVNLDIIKENNLSPISVMIFTNLSKERYTVKPLETNKVKAGEVNILTINSAN